MKPKKITKKQFTMAALVIALALAVYLNWRFSENTPYQNLSVTDVVSNEDVIIDTEKNYGDAEFVSKPENGTSDYFAEARLTRTQTRDEAIDAIQRSLNQTDLTEAEKSELTAKLSEITNNSAVEGNIENIIKAKGIEDCVVIISDSGIKVVVKAPQTGLTDVDVSKIVEAVVSEVPITADKINIVEVS